MSHVYLIFRLRWMLFKNSLRNRSNLVEAGTGVFVALLVGFFDLAVGAGLGVLAYALYNEKYFGELVTCILGGILLMWLSVPVLTASFSDQMDAVRFRIYPLTKSEVLAIDLLLGLVDPSGLLVLPLLAGLFVGCAVRAPERSAATAAFLLVFYIFCLALSRYIQRLIGSFFSTRRRKEILGFLVFLLLFAPQMLMTFNSSRDRRYRGHGQRPTASQQDQQGDPLKRIEMVAAYLTWTPPGMVGRTIGGAGQQPVGQTLFLFVAVAAFAAGAVALEYERVDREYSGRESLWQRRFRRHVAAAAPAQVSRGDLRAGREHAPSDFRVADRTAELSSHDTERSPWARVIPSDVKAIAGKDIRYLYRSPRALLMFITPLFACVILAVPQSGIAISRITSSYQIPLLVLYAMFANSSQLFNNSFSFDRDGARLYFISPVRGRDVLTGKNLAATTACLLQLVAVMILYLILSRSFSAEGIVSGLLVLGVALPFDLTVGNYLSILYPRAVDFNKVYGRAYSGVSALMSLISSFVLAAIVGLAPLLAFATGSLEAQYGILVLECVLSTIAYFLFLKPAGRLFEERAEQFLQGLLASKQS